jgi:hypothetical protein
MIKLELVIYEILQRNFVKLTYLYQISDSWGLKIAFPFGVSGLGYVQDIG